MQVGIFGRPLTNPTQLKESIIDLIELLCDKVSTLCQKKSKTEKSRKTIPRQTKQTQQVRMASKQVCFMV